MADNLKSQTISSLCWKLFERGGNAIIQLIIQIVMARLLAPEQFGALAIMLVFVNVGNVIVQSGLNTSLIQAPNVSKIDYSSVFWLSFLISLFLYAVIFLFAPSVANFYNAQDLIWPLRALCIILIINSYNSVQVAIVSRSLQFRKIFVATIFSVVISGFIGIGSALAGMGLWALVLQQVSYQLFNCFVLATKIDWRPTREFDFSRAKKHFGYGWKLLLSGLLNTGFTSLADLIIGKQFDTASLGYVSQGAKYPQALGSMIDGSIQPVMLSTISKVQHSVADAKRIVRRAIKTSSYIMVPCMGAFAVMAKPLVVLLLGEQWLPCVPFLQIVCITQMFWPIHTSNLQAINAMGRSDVFLKLELIKKAYGIAWILIAAFVFHDLMLMYIGYIATDLLSSFVNAFPNKKILGYGYLEQIKDIAPSFIMTAISASIAIPIQLLNTTDFVTIIIQSIVMIATYLLMSKVFHVEAYEYLISTLYELFGGRQKTANTK